MSKTGTKESGLRAKREEPMNAEPVEAPVQDVTAVLAQKPGRAKRMKDSFTPDQKKKLEVQRQAHSNAVAEALQPKAKPARKRTNGHAIKRADGLTEGSKMALLIDTAVAAGKGGTTYEKLAQKLGWKGVSWTLKEVCKRVHAKLDEHDGKVFVSLKS